MSAKKVRYLELRTSALTKKVRTGASKCRPIGAAFAALLSAKLGWRAILFFAGSFWSPDGPSQAAAKEAVETAVASGDVTQAVKSELLVSLSLTVSDTVSVDLTVL